LKKALAKEFRRWHPRADSFEFFDGDAIGVRPIDEAAEAALRRR
jgi:hypothetical protein